MATLGPVPSGKPIGGASAERVGMRFEAVVIPVADVDHSKEFYSKLGWRLDADFPFDNGFRVVQFTPPGSACSVQFGAKITSAAPGSATWSSVPSASRTIRITGWITRCVP